MVTIANLLQNYFTQILFCVIFKGTEFSIAALRGFVGIHHWRQLQAGQALGRMRILGTQTFPQCKHTHVRIFLIS